MTTTLYASFERIEDAEKATGALMDHGLSPSDISLIAHETHIDRKGYVHTVEDDEVGEEASKTGITTTTSEDAEAGALKGAGIGLGLGIVAALAAIALPGVGLVLGGGALAMALGATAGATGAGAIAGGAFGYMKDQGVPEGTLSIYRQTFDQGGAILAVSIPEDASQYEMEATIAKYNGVGVSAYGLTAVR
jgi:hypothetical protein